MKQLGYYRLRFKSSLCWSDAWLGSLSTWKLPGQIESIASSITKGVQAILNPVLGSLNLAATSVPSRPGLCAREWGWAPSDRIVKELRGNPMVAIIILWDWYLLAAPLSLLCAFWWPPRACELKNFLMQKLHEKILLPAGFDWGSPSPVVKASFLLRLKLNHSPKLSSPDVFSSSDLVFDSASWLLLDTSFASSSLWLIVIALATTPKLYGLWAVGDLG